MDFEQLGEAWRSQPTAGGATPVEALALVQRRARELRQVVRIRDRIEIGLALLLLPIFAWLTFAGRTGVSRFGAAIIALACLLIPLRIWSARRAAPDPAQPLLLQLRRELAQTQAQDRLLSTVFWWYFAPLGLGVILFVAGAVPWPWAVLYAIVVVVSYSWLLQLNRRAVRNQLTPRARELESWITHLEQGT